MSPEETLLKINEAQVKQIEQLTAQLAQQANELTLLREQVAYLTQKIFGKSKETLPPDHQLTFFDAPEAPPIVEEDIEEVTAKRKKTKGRKKAILDQFPEQPVHHRLEGEACTCPTCEATLDAIGSYAVREEVIYLPAKLQRQVHYQHAYKCAACSKQGPEDKIIKAPVPKAPIDNSLGSASIIAQSMHQKFELKVPAYRQEKGWHRIGLPITRQQIANWHIRVSEYYLAPFYQLLKDTLLQQPMLHADETTYRVLESDTVNTHFWTFLSAKHSEKPITLYHHDPSRGAHVAQSFLGTYKGYIHCDMWKAYQALSNVELVGCWAHVRRKFIDAMPKDCPADALSRQAAERCDQFFTYERAWSELSDEERLGKRQTILKPKMDAFFDWLREQDPLSGSKLGEAIQYALTYESTFRTVLKDAKLALDNNRAERAIKPFVMGRKNWLFSATYEGATAAAIIMSIIETAKQNNLVPEKYITYLLEELPNLPTLANEEDWKAYLPWRSHVKERCQERTLPKPRNKK
ncbi:IS66 family transposase [Gracilibacillus timonensis]|uniref:IS66 family transposase n=2 Tax=Gracilibacillus timonensis TaxID=1816696 RepID=UPI000AC52CE5|nr:IS66 family transposase [Gracilibacillus timonensis]